MKDKQTLHKCQTSTNGHLSTTATSLQQQRPLKVVPTFQNDLLTSASLWINDWTEWFIHVQNSILFYCNLRSSNSIHTARRWPLFLFTVCCIDTFWFIFAKIGIFWPKMLQPPPKKQVSYYTTTRLPITAISLLQPLSSVSKVARSGI